MTDTPNESPDETTADENAYLDGFNEVKDFNYFFLERHTYWDC